MSPFFRPEATRTTVGLDTGPIARWVRLLRAFQKSFAGRACSLRNPGRSVSDHFPSTGTWFHCQTGFSAAAEKSSLRS